jgi:hypothetical protein
MQAFSGPLLFKVYLGRGYGNISQPVQACIVEGDGLSTSLGGKYVEETMN